MIRWGVLLLAAVVVLAAIIFSFFNIDSVRLDLLFGSFSAPLGILVLLALLLGAIAGGLTLYVGVVLPLRVRLARARREIKTAADVPRA
jgi:uncharacterized integral membrane protein